MDRRERNQFTSPQDEETRRDHYDHHLPKLGVDWHGFTETRDDLGLKSRFRGESSDST